MCIICVSPIGQPQPTETQIRHMFSANPHGAGYMTARGGRVEIHKGFMTVSDLLRQLRAEAFGPDDAVVYHFRVSTQGGTGPEMTHPFPLSRRLDVLRALDSTCAIGVAHNGIIPLTSDKSDTACSDTARFVSGYMHRLVRSPRDLRDPAVLELLQAVTCSRLALMDAEGYVATVGHFIRDGGLLFSNGTYRDFSTRLWKYPLKEAR